MGRTDLVLDIGAGEGALTAELARRSRQVRAIEIDPELVSGLRSRFAATGNVEIVCGDALRVALPDEPFRVVANIPFNLTTAIMRRLLDDPRVPLARADLVVELDVAWKRARCTPSTALGAYWGAWYEFALVRRLGATAFAPPPATDAGVLRIERREEPLVAAVDARAYRSLVSTAFESRASLRRKPARPRSRRSRSSASAASSASRPTRRRGSSTSTSGQASSATSAGLGRLLGDTGSFNPVPRGRKGVG